MEKNKFNAFGLWFEQNKSYGFRVENSREERLRMLYFAMSLRSMVCLQSIIICRTERESSVKSI